MDLITPGLGLIFWMLVIFTALVLLLRKFAWPAILKILHDREKSINDALHAADKAKEEMKLMQQKNEELFKQAKEERDAMLQEAKLMNEKLLEETRQKATLEANRIVENARNNINHEKMQAFIELKNQIANLSIEMAETILKQELSDKDVSKKLIETRVDKINLN